MYTDNHVMIIKSTNGQSSSSVLIIDPILTSDSGRYTCRAFNDAGQSFQEIYVEVLSQCKVDSWQS